MLNWVSAEIGRKAGIVMRTEWTGYTPLGIYSIICYKVKSFVENVTARYFGWT